MPLTQAAHEEAVGVVCHPSEPDLHQLKERYLQRGQQSQNVSLPREQEFYPNVQAGARGVLLRVLPFFESQDVVVIALGGPSRSGKGYMESTLQRLAKEQGIGLGTLPMDWFYLLHEQRGALAELLGREVTFDDPESIWYDRLLQTIAALKRGTPVKDILFCDYLYGNQGPQRVWQKNPRSLDHYNRQKNILIIDGIFADHPLSGIGAIADLRVHMESDGASQAVRRINIDGERGYNTEEATDILLGFVALKRNAHVDPNAAQADIRIQNTMRPEELMQRVPEAKQARFLLQTDPQLLPRFVDALRTKMPLLNIGQWSLADVYTGIPGRNPDDFARLRFVQGSQDIAKADMTISLHSRYAEEHRANYPLFAGSENVQRYIKGLQDCMGSPDGIVLLHKQRATLGANDGCTVHIDTNMRVTALDKAKPTILNNRLVAGENAVAMPIQIEISRGTAADIEAIAGHIKSMLGSYTVTQHNTFHRAKELV